jgi:hypothetical protein
MSQEAKKSAVPTCGNCKKLRSRIRTDFIPNKPEFWCGKEWIGFFPVKLCAKQLAFNFNQE